VHARDAWSGGGGAAQDTPLARHRTYLSKVLNGKHKQAKLSTNRKAAAGRITEKSARVLDDKSIIRLLSHIVLHLMTTRYPLLYLT
jgi:hypothetical protein